MCFWNDFLQLDLDKPWPVTLNTGVRYGMETDINTGCDDILFKLQPYILKL